MARKQCEFCRANGSALARGSTWLVFPRRHLASIGALGVSERVALLDDVQRTVAMLRADGEAAPVQVRWLEGAPGEDRHLHVEVSADRSGGGLLPVLTTGGTEDPFRRRLERALARAQQVDIAVAFVMEAGFERVRDGFQHLLERAGRLRIVTGDYLDVTEPDALHRLLDLGGENDGTVEARVFETARPGVVRGFHPKAYLFRAGDPADSVGFVGSSNLSVSALERGVEWNYGVVEGRDAEGFAALVASFEALFVDERTVELTAEWIEEYRARRQERRAVLRPASVDGVSSEGASQSDVLDQDLAVEAESEPEVVAPRPLQKLALEKLAQTRAEGFRAGLVVLATGLGKTWLAAFDTRNSARVLFVAHRREILEQALGVFRRVQRGRRMGKFTGEEKDAGAEVVFASVQTLARQGNLERFARDRFDYVVIDEFHHASAATYRRLIDYFEPGFLLGLTATPERSDGGDLLALCADNLVFRRDLAHGVECGDLAPFDYFGVPDDVDYAQIPWRSARFDEQVLTAALATNQRAENALEQLRSRGGHRALAFCCSVRHAEFMAEFFAGRGLRAVAVHSQTGSAPRGSSLEDLSKGALDVICCVDMFNEGVDVPAIDTVLMLRPTESRVLWLQQIGRGLRPCAGKERLSVIDYIGNHRSFLEKVRALLSVVGGGEECVDFDSLAGLRAAIGRIAAGELELPPGCGVTYELEAIEILRSLVAPRTRKEAQGEEDLVRFYEDFEERNGRRPTASEVAVTGVLKPAVLKRLGSWFEFVERQGGLTDAERSVLRAHGPFLREVERTAMLRSYKMLVLGAMLEAGNVPGEVTLDELAQGVAEFARGSEAGREDLEDVLDDMPALRRRLKSEPLRAWAGTKRGKGSSWFLLDGDRFVLRLTPVLEDEAQEVALRAMLDEIVRWRLIAYRDRVRARLFECRVAWNQRQPILMLPRRSRDEDALPFGDVPVYVEGERYTFRFAKIAVNTARRAGGSANELPALLQKWFGAQVGEPGQGESVLFERAEDGYRMRRPRAPDRSEKLKVVDEDGAELDASFRVDAEDGRLAVVFYSKGGKPKTNVDYARGLEVLLGRLAELNAPVVEIRLVDKDLRLEIEGFEYPINVPRGDELPPFRKLLSQAQARTGRRAGARGGGNQTKTIKLILGGVWGANADAFARDLRGEGR